MFSRPDGNIRLRSARRVLEATSDFQLRRPQVLQFFAPFILGAASRRPKDAAAPSWRDRLLNFVQGHPGHRLNVIADEVGANRGTAKYHLRMLERDDSLRVLRNIPHARYFPPSTHPRDLPLLALLLRGRVLELARTIADKPGSAQHEMTKSLPIHRKVFREYANLLMDHKLVEEVRRPHLCKYYPTKRLEGLLAQLPQDKDSIGGRSK